MLHIEKVKLNEVTFNFDLLLKIFIVFWVRGHLSPSVLTLKSIEIQTFLILSEIEMRYFYSNWYWKTISQVWYWFESLDQHCPLVSTPGHYQCFSKYKADCAIQLQFITFHRQFRLLQHKRLNLTNQVQVTSYPKIKYILHKENKAYMLFY